MHANQAGALIQQQLQEWHEDGKTILEPEDIDALNETIRANRLDYYAKRLKRIQENKLHDIGPQLNPDEQKLALKILRHIMALIANQESVNRNKNNTAFNTWQAMQHIAENLHPDLGAVQKCISKLEAIGAIRNMEFPTSFIQYKATTKKRTHDDASSLNPIAEPTVEEPVRALSVTPPTLPIAYVDCAIPSLTNYVLSAFPDKKAAIDRMNTANQQALAKFDEYLTTQWFWTDQPTLPKIPAYSAFDYNTQRTPTVLTPAQARKRKGEIEEVIHEQQAHQEQTSTSLPWPDDMPQIPNLNPPRAPLPS